MFMFRSGPLKCFPRRRCQILWRLRLFYGSLALPPPRSPAPPLPAEGTQLAAPFSPLRPRTERADVGPSADGPLSLPEKRKDGKGDGQLGGCLQRVEPHKNGHFGVLCGLFSHRRCALHPLPSKGQGEGRGCSAQGASSHGVTSSPSLSPGVPEGGPHMGFEKHDTFLKIRIGCQDLKWRDFILKSYS